MKISIIGDGGWGTALSILAHKNAFNTFLWGAFPEYVKKVGKSRKNLKFLPGVAIPRAVNITADLREAVKDSGLIVLAVPSQFMRSVVRKIAGLNCNLPGVVSVSKGIEAKTSLCMSDVIRQELGGLAQAALSGPNIAYEVARGVPSAAVCASADKKFSGLIQDVFMSDAFRVYTSKDIYGVELSGAFKNIIAIACGISDGLGYGANTKAALLTRGLAEIARLGVALGASYKTFSGLAGMGDLVTTCFSLKSRNRWFGEQIGRGKKMRDILARTDMVVEGVLTAKTALRIAEKHNVCLPITEQVYAVLYKNKKPFQAMRSLMQREKKQEH